jgi:hypothetical protein
MNALLKRLKTPAIEHRTVKTSGCQQDVLKRSSFLVPHFQHSVIQLFEWHRRGTGRAGRAENANLFKPLLLPLASVVNIETAVHNRIEKADWHR